MLRLRFDEEAARAQVDNAVAKYQAGGHGSECDCVRCQIVRALNGGAPDADQLSRLKAERIADMRREFYEARRRVVINGFAVAGHIIRAWAYLAVGLAACRYLGVV